LLETLKLLGKEAKNAVKRFATILYKNFQKLSSLKNTFFCKKTAATLRALPKEDVEDDGGY